MIGSFSATFTQDSRTKKAEEKELSAAEGTAWMGSSSADANFGSATGDSGA